MVEGHSDALRILPLQVESGRLPRDSIQGGDISHHPGIALKL